TAELLIRRVRHDAIEPGAEGGVASEGIDLAAHGPKRVLHHFLRIGRAARDADSQAIRPVTIGSNQSLGRRRLAPPEGVQERQITVGASRLSIHLTLPSRPQPRNRERNCQARSASGKRLPY